LSVRAGATPTDSCTLVWCSLLSILSVCDVSSPLDIEVELSDLGPFSPVVYPEGRARGASKTCDNFWMFSRWAISNESYRLYLRVVVCLVLLLREFYSIRYSMLSVGLL